MSPIAVTQLALLLVCIATLLGLSLLCTRHFNLNLLPDIEKTEELIQIVSAAQFRKCQQSENENLSKFQTKHSNQIKISEDIICEKPNSNLPIDLDN